MGSGGTPQPILPQIISKSQIALRPVLSEQGFNALFAMSQRSWVYGQQRRIQYADTLARSKHTSMTELILS